MMTAILINEDCLYIKYIFRKMMMDPYYRVKSDIHRKRPAFGVLCFVWMIFMAVLAGFFGYYSYNIETKDRCYVMENE
jgi:hypothetical protein